MDGLALWRHACLVALLFAAGIAVAPATAAEALTLTIKDHRFEPQTLSVPANEAFDLVVINRDATAEEFESNDFHVEKVINGGQRLTFHVGPLAPGSYAFFGDRHQDTALGNLFAE
jgi:hypothetical protein